MTRDEWKEKKVFNCEKHGDFISEERVFRRLKSCCPEGLKEAKLLKSKERFLKKARLKHGNKYIYHLDGITNLKNLKIECPLHGIFFQTLGNHYKHGCKKCGIDKCSKAHRKKNEKFIEQSNEVHNNYYNYEKVLYKGAHIHVTIICPKHGEFLQTPANHLSSHGCFSCRATTSKNEKLINDYLISNNIEFICQKRFEDLKTTDKTYLFFDFYLEQYNLLIEYDGEHHFRPIPFNKNKDSKLIFERIKYLDNLKEEYAKKNNINLHRITYKENTLERLTEIINYYRSKNDNITDSGYID